MHHCQAHIKAISLLLLVLAPLLIKAQESPDSVDAISYRLYLEQNWQQLDRYAERAIAQGTDFYYLRLRKGIAGFELKRYRSALVDFEKARMYLPGEQVATNYLYLCFIYTAQYEQAARLSRTFATAQARTTGSDRIGALRLLYAEGGVKLSDSSSRFNHPFFVTAGGIHAIKKSVFLHHAFTAYTQKEKRFAVQQYQYYLGVNLPLNNRWLLAFSTHGALLTGTQHNYTQTVATVLNPPPPPGAPPPGTHTVLVTEVNDSPFTGRLLAGAASISRSFKWVDLRLGTLAARLDTCEQFIGYATLDFFPFRNNRLSLGLTAYSHAEKNFTQSGVAFSPQFSAYLSSKVYLSAGYFQNSGNNIIEGNAYFINNSLDYTRQRLNFILSWNVLPGTWVSVNTVLEIKEHLQDHFAYTYLAVAPGLRFIPTKTNKSHESSSN